MPFLFQVIRFNFLVFFWPLPYREFAKQVFLRDGFAYRIYDTFFILFLKEKFLKYILKFYSYSAHFKDTTRIALVWKLILLGILNQLKKSANVIILIVHNNYVAKLCLVVISIAWSLLSVVLVL